MAKTILKEKEIKTTKKPKLIDVSLAEMISWWIMRAFLVFCIFSAKTAETAVFIGISLILTFAVSVAKLIFAKREGFFSRLSFSMQTYICLTAALGAGAGVGLGLLYTHEYYDVMLQLFSGVIGVLMGYGIAVAMKKTESKSDITFVTVFSMSFSGMLGMVRKLSTFFIDYYTGRSLTHSQFTGMKAWIVKLMGPMLSWEEQRPIYDMNEDFVLVFVGAVVGALVLGTVLKLKNRALYKKEKLSLSAVIKGIPERITSKIQLEADKIRTQASIFDIIFWWGVRFCMVKAFLDMYFVRETIAEAILLGANLIGTFGITIAHFLFPRDSIVCKLNYKVQTMIVSIVLMGSYGVNYIYVFDFTERFDLFIHFFSGSVVVLIGYYLVKPLFAEKSRMNSVRIALFGVAFSFFVMLSWEAMEFVGDYIWGTTSQNFIWEPTPESFFFKVFGHGVQEERLYSFFDTIYDTLLAVVTTIPTGLVVYLMLERERSKELKEN